MPSRTGADKKKKVSSRSKSSKHHNEFETVTIDSLALEIAEIMGEAGEY